MMEGEFKLSSFQSLECPVCLSTFNDPKILACSHTFCKACLDNLLECHGNDQKLQCPVCRANTQVPGREVNLLQTNLAVKSLLEDVSSQDQHCTDCESEEKPPAVVYCQDCGKYLCNTCKDQHSQWDIWSDHDVLNITDITSGKVLVRRYRKCKKHPREDEECFCSDCRRFACFRCGIKEHAHEKHQIMEASTYASAHRASVEDWKSQANDKHTRIRKYIDYIDEQRGSMQNVKKHCMDDIGRAFEESVRQLTEKKESLLQEVVRKNDEAGAALDVLKETAKQQMAQVTTMTDLVANGNKIPLETEALAAHDSLCQGLQDSLRQEDPDYKQPSTSSKQGRCIAFERYKGNDELALGKIVHTMRKNVELPVKIMSNMAATLDGMMALGCRQGGIEIISAYGQLQKTVLKNIGIRYVDFLSDGRYVVLDESNTITLYTRECERIDVKFETLSNEALYGRLAVDSDDLIYVNYIRADKIQVFSAAGGKAIREIPFRRGEAKLIAFKDFLIICEPVCVRVIDKAGRDKHKRITKQRCFTLCAVTLGGALLVAWVSHDGESVTIDEYTYELKYVKTLISEFKIENPRRRYGYYLQVFRSGEIAFSTLDKLYIFS